MSEERTENLTKGKKMANTTTATTAKTIRAELKAKFPTYKFQVRTVDCGVINIGYNGDKEIRAEIDAIANAYEGWNEFATQYVFVNAYGAMKQVA